MKNGHKRVGDSAKKLSGVFPFNYSIIAIEPTRQFEKQRRYEISLRVTKRESMERNSVRILGFSLIK